MTAGYQNVGSNEGDQVQDALETLVTEGARRMLESALEEEVSAFLGRDRYQKSSDFRGYRNGFHRSREITVGLNPVQVKVPRVSQVPAEVSKDGFTSQIVRRYERVRVRRSMGNLRFEGNKKGTSSSLVRR
ncbi:MAG TPA: hypothetical protein DC056_01565 [Dehalococcoidia bacterium]|nr:hypothetical protein [Dehalococcoidia bacterium]